jgi:Uma2 family endonuclease
MSTSRVKPRIRQRFGPSSAGLPMSPAEFDAITRVDERYRYELVHGVLVVTPRPSEAERDANGELGYLLHFYRDHHPQGSALDATLPEHKVRPGDDRRRADRVIWAGLGRHPDPVADVPTIAVEFVSRGKRDWLRDYEEKRREYLALGVKEYWVIDRFRRTMAVWRDDPTGPAERVVVEAEVYRTELLPGFELPLARLLAVADEWRRSKRKRKPR